jgi:hypothetical protein
MLTRKLAIAATILAVSALSGLAHADERDAAFYTSAFEKLGTSLAETQTADTTNVAATDVERVRTLMGQGQAFVANDKLEEAAPLLERAQVISRYARAKVERVAAEARAAEANNGATAAEKAAADVKAQADAMQAKYKDLEARGL